MDIAIVGAGCRLPGGVSGMEELWQMLQEGRDCITEIPGDRWSIRHFYDSVPQTPGKTNAKHGGFVEHTQAFDPQLFGISPREATSLDPQQRMLLEVAYETIEDAGMSLSDVEGTKTGVYVGIMNDDYKILLQNSVPQLNGYCNTGSSITLAANRLSYFLHTLGPSLSIDTACSSSLIALHLACESIQKGECGIDYI